MRASMVGRCLKDLAFKDPDFVFGVYRVSGSSAKSKERLRLGCGFKTAFGVLYSLTRFRQVPIHTEPLESFTL